MSDPAIDASISKWSNYYGVPEALVRAVISVESAFNPSAQNPQSSAAGLMQIIHGTWDWMVNKFQIPASWDSRYNPDTNVQVGTAYLKYNLDRYNGDTSKAIAAYYSGTPNGSADEQSYVSKVMGYYHQISNNIFVSPATGGAGTSGDSGASLLEALFLFAAAGTAFILLRRIL